MKFTPKEIEGNANVSSIRPLQEFFWLLGELALVLVGVYIGLGLLTDVAAEWMPLDAEVWLGERSLAAFAAEPDPALDRRLYELMSALPRDAGMRPFRYSVRVVESDAVNAVALPAGHIIVFSGLLKQVRSENELSMILAHELGHYAHRDHLRGLGRGLGLTLATQLLTGDSSAAAALVSNVTLPLTASYSQKQESAADTFAVDLLATRYGHAGGCVDFFCRLAAEEKGGKLPYVLASHPHPETRIDGIRQRIAVQGLVIRPTVPLGADVAVREWKKVPGGK